MTAAIEFDGELCDRNPHCPATRVCPTGAMVYDASVGAPTLSIDRCIGCGVCAEVCPRGAVRALQ